MLLANRLAATLCASTCTLVPQAEENKSGAALRHPRHCRGLGLSDCRAQCNVLALRVCQDWAGAAPSLALMHAHLLGTIFLDLRQTLCQDSPTRPVLTYM